MVNGHFANLLAPITCFATYEYLDARVCQDKTSYVNGETVTSFLPDAGMRSILWVCQTKTLDRNVEQIVVTVR